MKQHIFLTGITGFVGGWLARELLDRGHPVIALVNIRHDQCPEKRLAKLFQDWFYTPEEFAEFGDQLTVVGGDLAAPRLGITDEILKALPPFRSIIHCAGLVQFDQYLLPDLRDPPRVGDLLPPLRQPPARDDHDPRGQPVRPLLRRR